jgi:hypothetical protein
MPQPPSCIAAWPVKASGASATAAGPASHDGRPGRSPSATPSTAAAHNARTVQAWP